MLSRNGAGATSAATETTPEAASLPDRGESFSQKTDLGPDTVHAELDGDTTASAYGYTVISSSPLLACRDLIDAGHFDQPVAAYRGDTLCLCIRSIAEAAALKVASNGVGFRKIGGAA